MRSSGLSLTLLTSLVAAIVLLVVRILVLQRVQQRRQKENRQEAERLKWLVAAYRSLAGSFSPAGDGDGAQVEEALADIVLFGSPHQARLAAETASALASGQLVSYGALVDDLRADVRRQLGLDPLPPDVQLPPTGPGRLSRAGRKDGEGGGRAVEGRGAGGGGAGTGGSLVVAGGAGAGLGLKAGGDVEPSHE